MARSLTAAALLALALAAASPASADHNERDRSGGSDMQGSNNAPVEAPAASSEGEAPPPQDAAPADGAPGGGEAAAPAAPPDGGGGESAAPMTLSDAKANIGTIIQSFFAKRSVDGALPLRDKTTRRLRRLQLLKVDDKHVAEAGSSRYSAPASLKDLESGQTLQASFTVDFGGSDWKVVGMRLKPAGGKASR